jgi:hypothetical protein
MLKLLILNHRLINVYTQESADWISWSDVDVSYDGREWLHLFGSACLKNLPDFLNKSQSHKANGSDPSCWDCQPPVVINDGMPYSDLLATTDG